MLKCSLWQKWIHKKCIKELRKQYLYGQRQDSLTCFCLDCNKLFPFHNLENEELLYIFFRAKGRFHDNVYHNVSIIMIANYILLFQYMKEEIGVLKGYHIGI